MLCTSSASTSHSRESRDENSSQTLSLTNASLNSSLDSSNQSTAEHNISAKALNTQSSTNAPVSALLAKFSSKAVQAHSRPSASHSLPLSELKARSAFAACFNSVPANGDLENAYGIAVANEPPSAQASKAATHLMSYHSRFVIPSDFVGQLSRYKAQHSFGRVLALAANTCANDQSEMSKFNESTDPILDL